MLLVGFDHGICVHELDTVLDRSDRVKWFIASWVTSQLD